MNKIRTFKILKIKLKKIEEPKEIIGLVKDVNYFYSIDDSSGLLQICLTMYNEIDPLDEFLNHVPDLYKYNTPIEYDIFYKNCKYELIPTDNTGIDYKRYKIEMY